MNFIIGQSYECTKCPNTTRYEDILFNPGISVQQRVVTNTKTKYLEELHNSKTWIARRCITSSGVEYSFNDTM